MTDAAVLKTLQDAVKLAVAASNTPVLPIKFIGRIWEPPVNGGAYLELVFIPNNLDNYWNDETLFQGIFRMVLHQPLDDQGAYTPLGNIASIASFFKKSTPLHGENITLQIQQKPLVGGMIPTDTSNMFPASLSYRSFQP